MRDHIGACVVQSAHSFGRRNALGLYIALPTGSRKLGWSFNLGFRPLFLDSSAITIGAMMAATTINKAPHTHIVASSSVGIVCAPVEYVGLTLHGKASMLPRYAGCIA